MPETETQYIHRKSSQTVKTAHIYEFFRLFCNFGARSDAAVEALRYKPEGRGIDSGWCHWNFSMT
jgi:hypothetical protein